MATNDKTKGRKTRGNTSGDWLAQAMTSDNEYMIKAASSRARRGKSNSKRGHK